MRQPRRRARQTLVADLEDIIDRTEQKMLDVITLSLQDATINMQTPVSRGGKMRVDTGFLRASARSSLSGFPSGNGVRPADAPVGQYTGVYDDWDGNSVTATLINLKLGDTFYFGWVANYAPARELYDGFMEASLQNWPRFVAFAIDTVNKGSR